MVDEPIPNELMASYIRNIIGGTNQLKVNLLG